MDIVVIVIVLGALAVLFFKKFKHFIYYIAMIDIFLRVVYFIGTNIPVTAINDFIMTYLPSSIPGIIRVYSSGIFETVLLWIVVILYGIFDYYLFRIFLKQK